MGTLTRRIPMALMVFLACATFAHAQAAPAADISTPLVQMAQRFQDNFMALAKAMPADKYNFAPSSAIFKPGSPAKFDTVRTFGQQITHVTGECYSFFEPFGIKPDSAVDLKAVNALTSKDEILKALQAGFDYENKVIATITAENAFVPKGPRNTTLVAALVHALNDGGDHYGQLVEYGRMNGIIPPATERAQQTQSAPAAQAK